MLETNYKFGEVYSLTNQIEIDSEKIAFKNIFANNNGGVALVAFRAGQKLDTHMAPAEVMVDVLEGEIEFTMLGKSHIMKAGDFLLMGEAVPHSAAAKVDSIIMLVKVKA